MEIYTVKEVAKLLRCDIHVVYDLIRQDKLKTFTIDTGTHRTSTRIRDKELQELIDNLVYKPN